MKTLLVVWSVNVEVDDDASAVDAAREVAKRYFQNRIADGEPDTACNFEVYGENLYPFGGESVDLSESDAE